MTAIPNLKPGHPTYLTKVVEVDGDIVMLFPEELMKTLDLKANEVLKWTVDGDDINIKRVRLIDNLITKVASAT